jgi:hypothetical protein
MKGEKKNQQRFKVTICKVILNFQIHKVKFQNFIYKFFLKFRKLVTLASSYACSRLTWLLSIYMLPSKDKIPFQVLRYVFLGNGSHIFWMSEHSITRHLLGC